MRCRRMRAGQGCTRRGWGGQRGTRGTNPQRKNPKMQPVRQCAGVGEGGGKGREGKEGRVIHRLSSAAAWMAAGRADRWPKSSRRSGRGCRKYRRWGPPAGTGRRRVTGDGEGEATGEGRGLTGETLLGLRSAIAVQYSTATRRCAGLCKFAARATARPAARPRGQDRRQFHFLVCSRQCAIGR